MCHLVDLQDMDGRPASAAKWPSHREDDGFTLIELLGVIIIIGILAAIAIPVFLGQRHKGYDAAAKSDLRNLANFEEVYLSDYNSYGTLADILATEPRVFATKTVTLTVVRIDGVNGYCLSASSSGSGKTWFYDSRDGGLQPSGATNCPVVVTGVAGGSITG